MNNTTTTSVIETKGIAATSFAETLKAADLDWEPKEDKVAGLDTGVIMPRKKLLYRSDNNQVLGIVGQDYAPSSPKNFLETQYEFAEFIKGKVTRAGFMHDRSRAFAFIRMNENLTLPRNLREKGDPTAVYIYSVDGWDGGTPRRSRLYLERLRCTNGMVSKETTADLWVSHTRNSQERYSTQWKVFLGEIRTQVEQIRVDFTAMVKKRMSESEARTFLGKLIPGETKMSENKRNEVFNLFVRGVGNEGSTRWDAMNAVTEYVTHHRSYRATDATDATDATAEDTNRFLGVMETDTMRRQAYSLLVA